MGGWVGGWVGGSMSLPLLGLVHVAAVALVDVAEDCGGGRVGGWVGKERKRERSGGMNDGVGR